MKVFINDEEVEICKDVSLSFFLNDRGLDDFQGWAVAVNEEIIPLHSVNNVRLKEGDEIILVQATQGG